jgi:hypothetical protein
VNDEHQATVFRHPDRSRLVEKPSHHSFQVDGAELFQRISQNGVVHFVFPFVRLLLGHAGTTSRLR